MIQGIRLLIALFVLHPCVVFAETPRDLPAPDVILQRAKEAYAPTCCFHARFDQVTVNVSMDFRDKFQGMIYVRKPDMIALEVETPEKQKVVLKGKAYTVFFPDEGSAARGEVPSELNVDHFLGFFANIGNVDRNFSVAYAAKPFSEEDGLYLLELTDPKNPQSTYRVVLGIDPEKYTIKRAVIFDALGNYNRFDLFEITFVSSLPEHRFSVEYGHQDAVREKASPGAGSETK
ncbi:MAG: outer membrane lipoprotein carrier protein LolA [Pseudomonadota bacterium]